MNPSLSVSSHSTLLPRLVANLRRLLVGAVAVVVALSACGCEQSMITRTNVAADVVRDFELSDKPIPETEFTGATAVAVLRASEGGVVVTGGGGKGVMVKRTGDTWSAPIALDLAAGSFGAQIGGKSYDVIMIFRNADEVTKVIRNGGYSIADASATAGPANADAQDNDNPVKTFVRADGLFVGARVGGVKFIVNEEVNHETYGISWSVEEILAGKVKPPLGSSELYRTLPAPR